MACTDADWWELAGGLWSSLLQIMAISGWNVCTFSSPNGHRMLASRLVNFSKKKKI
jgi:hypothetical protein